MPTPRHAIAKADFSVARYRTMAAAVPAAWSWVIHCRDRAGQRRALAHLDDRLLRDIGLNRTDVAAECRKWFWLP